MSNTVDVLRRIRATEYEIYLTKGAEAFVLVPELPVAPRGQGVISLRGENDFIVAFENLRIRIERPTDWDFVQRVLGARSVFLVAVGRENADYPLYVQRAQEHSTHVRADFEGRDA